MMIALAGLMVDCPRMRKEDKRDKASLNKIRGRFTVYIITRKVGPLGKLNQFLVLGGLKINTPPPPPKYYGISIYAKKLLL